jgi:hypothetical protein
MAKAKKKSGNRKVTAKKQGSRPLAALPENKIKNSRAAASAASAGSSKTTQGADSRQTVKPESTPQIIASTANMPSPWEPVDTPAAKKIEKPAPSQAAPSGHSGTSGTAKEEAPDGKATGEQQVIAAKPVQPAPAARLEVPPAGKPQAISLPPSVLQARRRRRMKQVLTALVAAALIALAGFIYVSRRPVTLAADDQKLISEVAKRAVVPRDETPAVSTVIDEKKVNQDFLLGTRNGDKVLLYFQAGRAIVYRPSSGQIVNMGPLQTPKPRVFIRNGATGDQTQKVTDQISASGEFILSSRDESRKKTYANTVVIDVAGNRPDVAGKLARLLHVNVGTLPEGEIAPDADLLVIVGNSTTAP